MLATVAKDDHPQASIDWASATVKNGDLTVALAGEPSGEWAQRVQAVLDRLDRSGSDWGATKVTKTGVQVKAVAAGAEDDLRHLLDSAVQQANADFAPADEGGGSGDGDELSEADSAMTDAFRSFSDATPDDDRPAQPQDS
jgi:hypothetical protein